MTYKLALAALVATCTTSCSVVFQDSVRSSSVDCSTSRFWYVSDILLAAADIAAVQRVDAVSTAYIPAAVFGSSALIGIYKRHHCVEFREHASPEVWAAAAEARRQRAQRQAEADAAAAVAQAEAQAQAQAQWQAMIEQQQQQQAQPAPMPVQSPGGAGPQPQWRSPPAAAAPTPIVHVQAPSRAGRIARSRAECDQQLPLPAHPQAATMGADVRMAEMNREPCYRCADARKTFSIYALPPSYQYSCD